MDELLEVSHLCWPCPTCDIDSLWSPCGIGQTIIFSSCGFFFFLLFFFSSPNFSHRRLDVCHTSTQVFFPIVNTCLSCEDIIARQSCAMVLRWPVLATFLRPVFSTSRVQHVSDLYPKFALSANLGYRSETCWTRLAENIGRKKVAKTGHLSTSTQLCRAIISSQLRHVLTIGKKTC